MGAEGRRSPFAAFVLSVVPGAGHLYAGRVGAGVLWLFVAFVAYSAAPPLGVLVHFLAAVSAARAVSAANRREQQALSRRRESAAEVAALLDRAVAGREPSPAEEPARGRSFEADPPPRLLRGAFPVPPADLVTTLSRAMKESGLRVEAVDEARHRLRGTEALGPGLAAVVVAQVEPTPTGSRVRMILDRPEGAPLDPDADDARLREILVRAEETLGEEAPGDARPAAAIDASEALTEDHFLEQLREAWESYEQGWLPDEEWVRRKGGLLRGVVLRPDTRLGDFLAACGPLVEAGVLDPEELGELEFTLRR